MVDLLLARKGTHFWYLLKSCVRMDFLFCSIFMKDNLSMVEFELFVLSAWAIWKELCNMKHNSKPLSSIISLEWVAAFHDEFKKARRECEELPITNHEESAKRWVKPPDGQYRLDVDAGFHDNVGKYSVGAVIRDHSGNIVAALACDIRNPGSALAAEIMAIYRGGIGASQSSVLQNAMSSSRLILRSTNVGNLEMVYAVQDGAPDVAFCPAGSRGCLGS